MVRTIYVVFTNIRLSDPQVRNMKQYKFLCPYDMVQDSSRRRSEEDYCSQ